MKIVIAGAGEVGTHLAKLLSREDMEISLLDEHQDRLGDLSANYDIANSTINKIFLLSIAGADGNFQQGQSILDPNKYEYPDEGIVLRFTFDVTDPLAIKAVVEEATF